MSDSPLRTDWTRSVVRGVAPDAAALLSHLQAVHRSHAGFTERCATGCRDARGRTTYAWLAEAVVPARNRVLLDVACGSGPLLQLCHERLPPDWQLIGIDLAAEELALARPRLPPGRARLVEAQAQQLDFLADASVDVALCHWALTLMDPVEPVLAELARVIAPGGRFGAIVDGPMAAAPGYAQVHDLIYRHVQAELPNYGQVDLGDPRVRDAASLAALLADAFPGAAVRIETGVVSMSGPADALAAEAAGFFYAALLLSPAARQDMLDAVTRLLSDTPPSRPPSFSMPVSRMTVDLPPPP